MPPLTAAYLSLLRKAPLGNHRAGEIEILTNRRELNGAFLAWARKNGRRPPYTGVMYRDDYIAVVRDAVQFPDGSLGDYLRVFLTPLKALHDGVIVVPLDGKHVCVRRMFRHATRCWQLELPRGGIEEGETARGAAARELEQETGLQATRVRGAGVLFPDTGLIASSSEVFVADVRRKGKRKAMPERSEAMGRIEWVDHKGFLRRLRSGAICDALTIGALQLARARGYWRG